MKTGCPLLNLQIERQIINTGLIGYLVSFWKQKLMHQRQLDRYDFGDQKAFRINNLKVPAPESSLSSCHMYENLARKKN
jgi:hypothetical protein